jgi:K+-transporting ATPase KdpF subunit
MNDEALYGVTGIVALALLVYLILALLKPEWFGWINLADSRSEPDPTRQHYLITVPGVGYRIRV